MTQSPPIVEGDTPPQRQEANAPDYGAGRTCPECGVDLAGQSPRKHAARHWNDPLALFNEQQPGEAYNRIKQLYDMEPVHYPVPPRRIDQSRS